MTRPATTPASPTYRTPRVLAWTAAVGVSIATAFALQPSLEGWSLWNDAVEHLAIGRAWASGAGFVNPVQYLPYYESDAVMPGFVVRAPVVPALAAASFAAGATVLTVVRIHAIWSCAIVGLLLLGAGRMLGLAAATGAALWIGLMPAWLHVARMPMTETTAVATFVAVLASVGWAARSVAGAAACAGLTLLATATRPNFVVLGATAFLAIVLEPGLFRGLRRPFGWIFLGTFAGTVLLLVGVTFAATGFELYAGYGDLAAHLLERGGSAEAVDVAAENAVRLWNLLAAHQYGRCLWLALPGVAWCAWGGLRARTERRFCALSTLAFAAAAVATLGRWDANRYPLPVAVPAVLCAAALVDDLVALVARLVPPRGRRAVALAPLLVLVPLALGGRDPARTFATDFWFLRDAASAPIRPVGAQRAIGFLCRSIPPDVLVVANDPWSVHAWCGNPAALLPRGLRSHPARKRYFRNRGASYVVTRGPVPKAWRRGPVHLEQVVAAQPYVLYRVVGAKREPYRWSSPGPLVCAGRPPGCAAFPGGAPAPP